MANPTPTEDWFLRQRQEQALTDAFIYTYADTETEQTFHAIDTFDTTYCHDCHEETEMIEEIRVSFMGEVGGQEMHAQIHRLRHPRIFCRECLSAIDPD